jgi:hypothetical protein
MGLPVEQLHGAIGTGVCAGHVAWAALGISRMDRDVRHAVEGVEQFAHGGAFPGAEVDDSVTVPRR